jgi:excisionase family DNA binding protein
MEMIQERRKHNSRLLTMEQAAIYLNMPLNTLYKMVSQEKVPVVKINRHNRFDQGMLDKWIKENTKMPMY